MKVLRFILFLITYVFIISFIWIVFICDRLFCVRASHAFANRLCLFSWDICASYTLIITLMPSSTCIVESFWWASALSTFWSFVISAFACDCQNFTLTTITCMRNGSIVYSVLQLVTIQVCISSSVCVLHGFCLWTIFTNYGILFLIRKRLQKVDVYTLCQNVDWCIESRRANIVHVFRRCEVPSKELRWFTLELGGRSKNVLRAVTIRSYYR